MRSDMVKVLSTRPRRRRTNTTPQNGWNNGIGTRVPGWNLESEEYDIDLPKHEGRFKRYGWEVRESGYYGNPLSRYLQANAGRPWNDVYSEICHTFVGKAAWRHRQQLDWMIDLHVQLIDGKPYDMNGRELYSWRTHGSYYVHPDTGILSEAPYREPYRGRYRGAEIVELTPTHFLEKMEGIWYDVGHRRRDEAYPQGYFTNPIWIYDYKRQLCKKELRRYGLKNG